MVDAYTKTPSEDDYEAVQRCKKGDLHAFQGLVERYQKKMLNIAYRMIGDYEGACDVVQDSFLSAYRAIGKFRGDARFSTWLSGIVVNTAKNYLKHTVRLGRHEVHSIDTPVETEDGTVNYDPPSDQPSAVEQLERKEVQEKVQQCIACLDEEFREVVILRDIEGFTYDEIGEMLRIPDGTVKSRLFRARENLKNCLKKVFGDL